MHAEPPASEQGFPRTYRTHTRSRRFINTFLLVFASFWLFFTVVDWRGRGLRSGPSHGIIVVDLVVAVWVAGIGSTYNKRVVIHEDSVEVAGWFYSRELNFGEIRGRLTTGSSRLPYGYAHIFVPTDNSKRKLALPPYLHTDQFFRDWIKTIPKISR